MNGGRRRSRNRGGIAFGITLMLLGIILVLRNTGLVHLPVGGQWGLAFWSLFFIILGLTKLFTSLSGRPEGIGFLFVGSWLMLNLLHVLRYRDSWPILIVGIGISIVWNALVGPPTTRE